MKTRNVIAAIALISVVIVGTIVAVLLTQPRTIETTATITPQRSQYVTEYSTGSSASAPNGIAVDSKGEVWITLENQTALAELIPSNGTLHTFQLPESNRKGSVTWGVAIDNQRGLVWFTEQVTNAIWSFNMNTHVFKEYPLKTPNAFPFDIAIDQKGNVWFTELFSDKIGEVTTQGKLIEIPVPMKGDLEPSGVAIGPNGSVWFTLPGVETIGKYSAGNFAFYNLSKFISCPDTSCPTAISVDPQGNVWTTFHGPKLVSEFNPRTAYFRTISTSVPPLETSLPYFIEATENGDVWFNEHYGNAMALFEPSNNTLIEYYDPTKLSWTGNISGMLTMGLSDSGVSWFTEFFAGKVGTVNTSAPLPVDLNILNYSTVSETPISVANNSEISLRLSIRSQSSTPFVLEGTSGNLTGNFAYSFAPPAGVGNTSSILTIHNNGSHPGVYFLTISVRTNNVAVSKIVEVSVP
ncbi:MAG: SMP-30/gluconolactonase/LRE family protein [Nitrososphaerota archaeon]|nr:SMP-30/gluconolactonase/LRE family protein [Nitrososphaerota archaeon]